MGLDLGIIYIKRKNQLDLMKREKYSSIINRSIDILKIDLEEELKHVIREPFSNIDKHYDPFSTFEERYNTFIDKMEEELNEERNKKTETKGGFI